MWDKEAIKNLKNNKAFEVDRVPTDFLKADIQLAIKVVKDINYLILSGMKREYWRDGKNDLN